MKNVGWDWLRRLELPNALQSCVEKVNCARGAENAETWLVTPRLFVANHEGISYRRKYLNGAIDAR